MNAGKHGFNVYTCAADDLLEESRSIGHFTACAGTTQSNRSGGEKGEGEGRSLVLR